MAKQGFKNISSNTFIYQEQTASAAIGLDSADSNKLKINASSTTGATPTGSAAIVIDGSTNGDVTITPKGSGNVVLNGAYLNSVDSPIGVALIDSTGVVGSTAQGNDGTVLIGNTGAAPTFSNSPSVTMITIADAPTVGTDGANKAYVDSVAGGFTFIAEAFAASTTAFTVTYNNGAAGVGATLTNAGVQTTFTVDGVMPTVAQRVLIKDQADQTQNGIYTVTNVGSGATNWVLTRATDYDEPSEINPGDLVPVTDGTLNAGTSWLQTATVTTIGTDPIIFIPFTLNASAFLLKVNNLSDVDSVSDARSNLGLTNVAIQTVTDHSVLVGGTSDSITSIAVGSTGQVLVGSTAADPAFAALGTNSGLTQHGVLLGQNNSAITAVTNGTTGQFLAAQTGADPQWSQVPLTSGVTGVLPIANGGTNASSMATTNGVTYFDGTRLVTTTAGTAGQVLTSNGAGLAPTYQAGGGGTTAIITTSYTTPGAYTFTKNASTKVVEVYGWGGGGAGASGGTSGGGGGGGGGCMYYKIPASYLNSSVNVVVGSGGVPVLGSSGGDGSPSKFGNFTTGVGGKGGGPNNVPGLGGFVYSSPLNSLSFVVSGAVINQGGSGSTTNGNNAVAVMLGNMMPSGGGGGAGPSGSAAGNGGNLVSNDGSSTIILAGGAGAVLPTVNGSPGNNGNTTTDFLSGGTGGGGGANLGSGGNGGFPGGGGGGCGSTFGGVRNGGTGGDGMILVIEYLSA